MEVKGARCTWGGDRVLTINHFQYETILSGPQSKCLQALSKGQKVMDLTLREGYKVPEGRSHCRKGSSPGLLQSKFLDQQGPQPTPSASAGGADQSL